MISYLHFSEGILSSLLVFFKCAVKLSWEILVYDNYLLETIHFYSISCGFLFWCWTIETHGITFVPTSVFAPEIFELKSVGHLELCEKYSSHLYHFLCKVASMDSYSNLRLFCTSVFHFYPVNEKKQFYEGYRPPASI